jgi:hypothetical protein
MKSVVDILQQEAPYLDSPRNKALLVLFLSTFTLIFFAVYNPFNMIEWGGSIIGYVGIGAAVLLISQFLFRRLLGIRKFKLYELVLWGVGEILVLTYFVYLVYGPEFPTYIEKIDEYFLTLKYVCLIILCPYIMFVWYIAFTEKFYSYKEVAHNGLSIDTKIDNELLTINGENNKVILAINYNQLLYAKSSGNYLDIYYLKGEIASKELVRVSLKELEAKIKNTSILRIHRSYMVNKHKISSFKKTRKGYKLLVQHAPEEVLPVSSGYKEKFEEALKI